MPQEHHGNGEEEAQEAREGLMGGGGEARVRGGPRSQGRKYIFR